jgi:hypothetical protein
MLREVLIRSPAPISCIISVERAKMANVLSTVYFVIGVIITHSCMLIWTALLLPQSVRRAQVQLQKRPVRSGIIGIVVCLATVLLFAAILAFRPYMIRGVNHLLESLSQRLDVSRTYNDAWVLANLLGWILTIPAFAAMVVGGAAFAQTFANRARTAMRTDSPLLALCFGAICTTSACFVPFAGWFVFLPIVSMMSVGAGFVGIFSKADRLSKPRDVEPF